MIDPFSSAITAFVTVVAFTVGLALGWVRYSGQRVPETKIVYCQGEADCQRLREEQVRVRGSIPSADTPR